MPIIQPMRDVDTDTMRKARLAFLSVLGGVMLFGAATAAWHSGRPWLAVMFGFAMVLVVGLPSFTFDSDDESEAKRWGPNGERWSTSDAEFEDLVREVEQTARTGPISTPLDVEDDFEAIVRDAIEELPDFVRAELDRNVAVIVADDGDKPENYGSDASGLFGLYVGWTAAHPNQAARIFLFRDILTQHFNDPVALKEQIVITLRHEVAHHLGADEDRVRALGL